MKKLNPPPLTPSIPAGGPDPGPIVDFAHLSSGMALEATDDFLHPPYGFPAAGKEDLYTTGYLHRFFLRC
ncbi:MAG TPA: hypothetical protein P5208_07550 [Smithellaceae bacterium]|nr:hypothetical protein [Smithellaceae bacterium]